MRYSSLDEWLHWQERLHPQDIELGLERAAAVWKRLRPGGLHCPVISVAGTNGKGSCVAMLEAMLRAAGYRIGCYSSPHLLRYNERIRINGQEVQDPPLCAAFERIDLARGDISLTYFEFGTLAALDLFAATELDCVILEVGLGGRLDAVNILDADLSLVTGVALDHMDWLGHDLDNIAREKAGICRAGKPLVIGQADPPPGLIRAAEDMGAIVLRREKDFSLRDEGMTWSWLGPARSRPALPRPVLRAAHQLDNAAAVLMALDCLSDRLPLGQDAVREGLLGVRLAGRLQVFPGVVSLVLDVAHNPQAAGNLAQDLASIPCSGITHAVFGCFRDKDAAGMMNALRSQVDVWHLAFIGGERARPAQDLANILNQSGVAAPSHTHDSLKQALQQVRAQARPGDRVLVTGSFLTVAACLEHLGEADDWYNLNLL